MNLPPSLFTPTPDIGGQGQPGIQASEADSDLPLAGRNILVVEDESLIALLIGDALEDAGATVVGPCYTLSECMRASCEERIDAAILDVDLGGQDVFPAAEELRRRGVPFLFHTGHGDRTELRARFGEVTVCRKPTSMDDLLASLARLARGDPAN